MRIYKIKDQEKFDRAKDLLDLLKNQETANRATIENEITPFKWTEYVGYEPGFHLLREYLAFIPKPKLKDIPEGWKYSKDFPNALEPNRRTKKGKEIKKLLGALPNYSFNKIEDTLSISLVSTGRFTIPALRRSKNKKHIFLITDDKSKLKEKDFKEVTLTYVNKKLGIKN